LLGYILDRLLTPLGITVKTRVRLMAESPEADILLLRREAPCWTEAQRNLLPDGIRDTQADHILWTLDKRFLMKIFWINAIILFYYHKYMEEGHEHSIIPL
jgi:hypothetical protein